MKQKKLTEYKCMKEHTKRQILLETKFVYLPVEPNIKDKNQKCFYKVLII